MSTEIQEDHQTLAATGSEVILARGLVDLVPCDDVWGLPSGSPMYRPGPSMTSSIGLALVLQS